MRDTDEQPPVAIRYPSVRVCLTTGDGNAYVILGTIRRAVLGAGLPDGKQVWQAFHAEATRGDYDHLLATAMRWFDID
jgi:hypothetical protein